MQGNITLDRLSYQAMTFLKLQGETKDWIEAVTGKTLKSDDMHEELKNGQVLCSLINTLFPGAIKRIHKSSFKAHSLENVGFVLKCLQKMGMREDELFEPADLSDKKNMMKVFKCMATFSASLPAGTGAKWTSRTDANFSVQEIDQWKRDYGDIEMEFKLEPAEDVEEVDLGPPKPDPVVKADPADFLVSENVTPAMLAVTLKELVQAVNKVDGFEKHDAPQVTADATADASLKAAQYAAQVKAASAQATDATQKRRLGEAYTAIDEANEAMVDAQNAYQDYPDSDAAKKNLHKACADLKHAAQNAYNVASRRPAVCAAESDFSSSRAVTVADADVGLAELVKAVKIARNKDGKEPLTTTEETENASKKAAKYAQQVRALGTQRASQGDAAGQEYKTRMAVHADALAAANEKMVAANNEYVLSPEDKVAARKHDEACDNLIRVAEAADKDVQKAPPAPVKRSTYSDFDIKGVVTGADLDASLNDVLKSVKKVEQYKEDPPTKTASNAETANKRVAYLGAQLRAVEKEVDDEKARKKIAQSYTELETANQALADATDVYVANDEDEERRKALEAACADVKKRSVAAVSTAKDALDAKAKARQMADQQASKVQSVEGVDESTPLHFATLKGDMSAVRDLINKGMKVDATNAQGWTPLYTAAWVGNLDLIRFFVKQGADVNVKNQEGWTPIFAAVAQGHKNVVKALAQDYKADVNVQSNQGTTPLYHAAEGGRYSISKYLLDAGADTELGKKDSWKPIHGAVYNYHARCTALLIAKGAHLNVHNKELKDYTPLHIAISTKKPNMEIVDMLAAKSDIDAKNKNGATPLHLAVMWGHADVMTCLLKHGANLSAKNNKGRTALDVAVRNDKQQLAEVLAKRMGTKVPNLRRKITQIGSIAAPEAPPPPPDQQ